jgi:hypothetical protein
MPHPDGRETVAERHYQKQRGPLGFHVLTGPSPAVDHKVPRELARALWRAGYDVSVGFDDTGQTGWGRTSIRHLEGMVKQPFVLLSYGPALKDYPGQVRVQIESTDTGHHEDERHLQYINERVDLLIVPSQSSYDAYQQAGVTIPISVVPWGVDTVVYQPWPRDEELLSKVVFPGGPRKGEKLFLTIGRTDPKYGLRDCIGAFVVAYRSGLQASLIIAQDPYSYHEDVTDLVMGMDRDIPIAIVSGLDEWSAARLYSMMDGVSWGGMTDAGCLRVAEWACTRGGPDALAEEERTEFSWDTSAAALVAAVREHVTQPALWSNDDDYLWEMANELVPSNFGPTSARGRIAVRSDAPSDEAGQQAMRTYSEAQLDFWWGDLMAHIRATGWS